MKDNIEKLKREKTKAADQLATTPAWKENICNAISDIVTHRNAMGITQQALADKIGVEQSVIGRFERMGRMPTLEFLYRIAEGLDMQIRPLRIKYNNIQKNQEDDMQLPEPQRARWEKDLAELVSDLSVYRVKKKITQAELAKRIGSTQSSIARFEYLDRIPSIQYIYRVAEGLDLTLLPIEIYYSDEEILNKIKWDVSWQYLQNDEIIINQPISASESLSILNHYIKIMEPQATDEDLNAPKPSKSKHNKKKEKTEQEIEDDANIPATISLLDHRKHGIA